VPATVVLAEQTKPVRVEDPEPSEVILPPPSRFKIASAIGIGAIILVAACGFWAWREYSHRTEATTSQQPPSKASAASITTPATTEQPKPQVQSHPAATETTTSVPTSVPNPQVPRTRTDTSLTSALTTESPQQAPVQPPVPAPVQISAEVRSGALHYHGPPVPLNGEVVYDNLPKARLRFRFDRQAWNLTIKLNPDGTKRVTLISQKPELQTSCDLGWEMID
jgi:cytoskeletal protein RodZ